MITKQLPNFVQMINYPRLPCTNNIALVFFFHLFLQKHNSGTLPLAVAGRAMLGSHKSKAEIMGGLTPGPWEAPLPLYGNNVSATSPDR